MTEATSREGPHELMQRPRTGRVLNRALEMADAAMAEGFEARPHRCRVGVVGRIKQRCESLPVHA